MQFGIKIREIRESKGVMQKFIDDKLGKYAGWLSRIEGGLQEVTARELNEIAELLGEPIGVFYLPINIANRDKNNNQSA